MPQFSILTHHTRACLFEGEFESFKACLEAAVSQRIPLAYADLRHTNLIGANLDDADLSNADLSGANLSGANLSESNLSGAIFDQAALYNTCLAYADCTDARFLYTEFGGTDIHNSILEKCRFAGLSCFSLNFMQAGTLTGCVIQNDDGTHTSFSSPPLVINGLHTQPVIILEGRTKIGHIDQNFETLAHTVFAYLTRRQAHRHT